MAIVSDTWNRPQSHALVLIEAYVLYVALPGSDLLQIYGLARSTLQCIPFELLIWPVHSSGLLLRSLDQVTIIQKPHYLLYVRNMVTWIKVLNSNPVLLLVPATVALYLLLSAGYEHFGGMRPRMLGWVLAFCGVCLVQAGSWGPLPWWCWCWLRPCIPTPRTVPKIPEILPTLQE